ncbi:DUF3152 domain-containing protein [Streptomyces sp. NBC_00557]|uniref:DUF3152 domain-containing protein n=1 Tax=Streptomyces sp. NBC_00557 TaxID=2975776 RepID=UPI002E80214D|nr:DUF3152 domain-containing protein [Streptomyces sp. NBC_00557]WUC34871.1 DUF3152 domain-containing protein [Streptomyces sp. NBC_00557]
MGRHSRRGPAPKNTSTDTAARPTDQRDSRAPGTAAPAARADRPLLPGQRPAPTPEGPAAAHGVPRLPDGTPAHGVPRLPDGTPAHGVPRLSEGTPAHGVPGFRGGAPARGGHPEQREAGGGWGEFAGAAGPGAVFPRQRSAGPGAVPGPRQEYLDAFADGHDGRRGGAGLDDDVNVFAPRAPRPGGPGPTEAHPANTPSTRSTRSTPEADGGDGVAVGPPAQRSRGGAPAGARGTGRATTTDAQSPDGTGTAPETAPGQDRRGPARAFTGVAAAAITTVLAVVVAGQVTGKHDTGAAQARSATGQARAARTPAGAGPSASPGTVTLSYEQAMDRKYPLSPTLKGSGKFGTVPGFDKAPGKGQKYTYRVDVEQGLGLDGRLFAEAVQKTLNDDRSWAHGGARTFERISSGKPDFVITLASPGTTATWCAKSGLDTTEDNVSCDSAATERVMINAYRWAEGSKTYGDEIHAYRQMLINHEVGHRLGHGHVTCQKNGELAPVMQQQTKFLDHDGIHCLPNPWPYPGS